VVANGFQEETGMKQRKIIKMLRGQRAVDGAGVRLVRVLSTENTEDFDPFLMLDSFDSTNPADYIAGFPMHPHRGIETITYLISGRIEHQDTLGNKGVIGSGESQWMTAGCGILHQEMPKPAERMLGFQLWLNLPRAEKMAEPEYLSLTGENIGETMLGKTRVRVLSGELGGAHGATPRHVQASVFDVSLPSGEQVEIPTRTEDTVFVFFIEGDGLVNGETIGEKTAVLFGPGEAVTVEAPATKGARFMFFSGKPLHEPIAWGGPIVMNTQAELSQAFSELERGVFIRRTQ
jgi:quercetin 2,3-dioxygenase